MAPQLSATARSDSWRRSGNGKLRGGARLGCVVMRHWWRQRASFKRPLSSCATDPRLPHNSWAWTLLQIRDHFVSSFFFSFETCSKIWNFIGILAETFLLKLSLKLLWISPENFQNKKLKRVSNFWNMQNPYETYLKHLKLVKPKLLKYCWNLPKLLEALWYILWNLLKLLEALWYVLWNLLKILEMCQNFFLWNTWKHAWNFKFENLKPSWNFYITETLRNFMKLLYRWKCIFTI